MWQWGRKEYVHVRVGTLETQKRVQSTEAGITVNLQTWMLGMEPMSLVKTVSALNKKSGALLGVF